MTQFVAPLHLDLKPRLQKLEVMSSFHIPTIQIIGLPNVEIQEAKERVRCAIEASGFEVPRRKLILNLSPAGIKKSGTGLDLILALGVLSHDSKKTLSKPVCAWAELGLSGELKPVGRLYRLLSACHENQIELVILEKSDAKKAQKIQSEEGEFKKIKIFEAQSLKDAWDILNKKDETKLIQETQWISQRNQNTESTSISTSLLHSLHPSILRLLGVISSGQHSLLLLGARGTGKSHLLEWLCQTIHSYKNPKFQKERRLALELREPYPDFLLPPIQRIGVGCRPQALLGSVLGSMHSDSGHLAIRPGACSLAHGGLLIADEFPEWARDTREALREPLERKHVTLTTTRGSIELPTSFQFIATGNLCPCGGIPHNISKNSNCTCNDTITKRYRDRLSGPLLDRIDATFLLLKPLSSTSIDLAQNQLKQIQKQILATQAHMLKYWGKLTGELTTIELEELLNQNPKWVESLCQLRWNTLRSRHKLFRLALSFSAWDQSATLNDHHWLEASRLRPEIAFLNE